MEQAEHPEVNAEILSRLRTLRQRGRLPHAMIFAGETGTGAPETALSFAEEWLGAKVGERFYAREEDPERIMWADGGVFFQIEPIRRKIRMEQVRTLQEALALSYQGNRVAIIEHAELMAKEPANAFLKTLEEPAPGICFILIVEEEAQLLPTIRSRAVTFRFEPLSEKAFHDFGKARHWAANEIDLLYHAAGGNPGAALQLRAEGADNGAREALRMWQALTFKRMPFTAFAGLWGKPARQEAINRIRWLAFIARDIRMYLGGAGRRFIRYRAAEKEVMELAAKWEEASIAAVFDILAEAQYALNVNISTQLVGDVLALRLTALQKGGI